jgi:ketosteroid isomerase-like protein
MLRLLTGLSTIVIAASVLASPARRAADDRALIMQTRRQQNAAIARSDFSAAAAAWTQDVSARAGLGRNIQGREQYLKAFIADTAMFYVREPTEVVVSTKWPLAYERGRWTGFRRASPKDALLSGQYSAQWVKSGSQWLIRSEVFVAIDCASQACAWPAVAP